jgi:UDP-glucose:glycoprotein glucosyltransferase
MRVVLILGRVICQAINIGLTTKSNFSPPLALEIIEHVSTHKFDFISDLKQAGFLTTESPEELYRHVTTDKKMLKYIGNVELLKASLCLHEQAPRIQALYHFYSNIESRKECDVWVDWGRNQICSLDTLKTLHFESYTQ